MTGNAEQAAVLADAEQRLAELRRVARRLWGDCDDAEVMPELVNVVGQIREAEATSKRRKDDATDRSEAMDIILSIGRDLISRPH